MEFCDNVGDHLCFTTPLIACLHHVSFPKYSPLSLEIVEKANKCIKFLAPNLFSGGTTPIFLQLIVSAVYFLLFDKVWLGSVC